MTATDAIQLTSSHERQGILVSIGLGLISAFVLAVLVAIDNVGAINVILPFVCLALAAVLYVTSPSYYLGFVLWIWLFAPLVRRLIDYKLGMFDPLAPTLLIPPLVSQFGALSFIRNIRVFVARPFFPFVLIVFVVILGLVMGIVRSGPLSALPEFLKWISPIWLGAHVAAHWNHYERLRSVVTTTLSYGLVLVGVYGIVQYFTLPVWDEFWMRSSGMTSFGRIEVQNFRVFSTVNGPGPLGMLLLAGLVIQFGGRGVLPLFASTIGVACLVLTKVRAAWLGLLISVGVAVLLMPGHHRKRFVTLIAGAALVGAVLFTIGPFSASINSTFQDRFDTFENLSEDDSFLARRSMYEANVRRVLLTQPLGTGIGGSRTLDSGFMTSLVQLGLIPGLVMLLGLAALGISAVRFGSIRDDLFAVLAIATFASFFALMGSGNQMIGIKGVILYLTATLPLAAGRYHESEVEAMEEQ